MIEVLLVFAVNGAQLELSDRIFLSYTECKDFVNDVANTEVVKDDYKFKFVASDGMLFEGQCIEMKEWFLKTGKTEI